MMVAYDKAARIGAGPTFKTTTVVPKIGEVFLYDGMVWSSKGVTQRIVVRLRDGWREWLEKSMDPEGRCRQDYAPLVGELFAGVLFYSTVPNLSHNACTHFKATERVESMKATVCYTDNELLTVVWQA